MPRPMKKDAIERFYGTLEKALPEPKTELAFSTPYELLVAVTLSAQATDVSVNAATRKLFPVARTPKAMVELGADGLAEYIRTIGLWRNKAKNVAALSALLLERHGGEVPDTREALTALPGVGRKTADVVLNVAFGQPTIAVDTHIFRVANRTGLASGKTADQVSDKLVKRTPDAYRQHAHHWLILHGRYLCKARTPECWRCDVREVCGFKDKTLSPEERRSASAKPKPKPKPKPKSKRTRKPKAA